MQTQTITEHFTQFLCRSYGESKSSGVDIKFEAVGHPIVKSDVEDYAFSNLVNAYPRADSEIFIPSEHKLDKLFDLILEGSKMLSSFDSSAFNKSKQTAINTFKKCQRAPSSSIPILYSLSNAMPTDWFDNDQHWNEYHVGQTQENNLKLNSNEEAVLNDLSFKPAESSSNRYFNSMTPIDEDLPTNITSKTEELDATINVKERVDAVRKLGTDVIDSTTQRTRVSLKYCIVKIDRKWLDESIFGVFRNWYMPNMKKGQLSKMPVGLQQLPVAIVVVREVSIKANWSANDENQIPKSASIGPFSLAGASWSRKHGKLVNKRTQIVGWICTPIPTVPPQSDPARLVQKKGYVRFDHDGWYVAKFKVSWQERTDNGDYQTKKWESGNQTMGYVQKVDIPSNAINIKIQAWAATALIWNPWGQIMLIETQSTPNKTYKVGGTTLDTNYKVIDPEVIA